MPLELQTTPVSPNSIYAPQIILQTGIVDGKLTTSAQLGLAAALVENAGTDTDTETWTATGQRNTIYISDIWQLDTDLAGLQAQIGTLYSAIVQLIADVNSIRKVL